MADALNIAKRLRAERERQKQSAESINESLAIVDAVIDEYDELIIKLDEKVPPLVAPINAKINAVQQAYLNRISHGCRSDLKWVKIDTKSLNIYNDSDEEVEVYEVRKDPVTFRFLGYYGAKFYRYPKNRDYGANVVLKINTADANADSAALIVLDDDASEIVGLSTVTAETSLKVGDLIKDSLDNPIIFQTAPSVTGVGTTDYAAQNYAVSGFCTAADNKIYGDQRVGFITDFNIGDEIYDNSDKTSDGFIPTGTTITGFGTAVGITSFVQSNGITTSIQIVLDFATLSNPVSSGVAATVGRNFHVGVVSSYNFVQLSDTPVTTGLSSSFLVIRPGDIDDIEFESSKNPIDPVEIGIAEGGNVGKGHRLELINNGDPKINPQWSEITSEPEPAVGAGRVEYYIGDTQWPVVVNNDDDGNSDESPAALGTRVVISVGSTSGAGVGYVNVPPSGSIPGDCGTFDAAIATAESEMNDIIAKNIPLINYYINGAVTLRELRDVDEGQAWGYLQAIGYSNAKGRSQLKQAESLEDFNWVDI
tara:strand:- start:1909 stop:3519 length:1611 start_codon:yes stop_codon:yes gene_type:complete